MAYEPVYTQDDFNAVRSAVIRLATGEQEVRVTVAGKTVEYAAQDLGKLKSLLAEIRADLSAAEGSAGFVLTSTEKGL